MKPTREAEVRSISPNSFGEKKMTPKATSEDGRERNVSLVSFCLPQARQSSVSKVLPCPNPLASTVAWISVSVHDTRKPHTSNKN
ncbi:hypothetical protein DPMN_181578 [Dreissena polymorpha]|uniref:Uncharacterized protein n=1 Tax=Dreissena polymorpha TaxID=45954 RepID=A0A9D4DFK3_DREPO|nr:hypothetical protein DPMN_181578 [Dreissena polymorpha]